MKETDLQEFTNWMAAALDARDLTLGTRGPCNGGGKRQGVGKRGGVRVYEL